jgi:nucleotide-binding universal stress UspA family protein
MVAQNPQPDRRIVVGVDGSAGAVTALRWALTQAQLTGATIEAIAAWQNPPVYGYAGGWTSGGLDSNELAAITQKSLDATVTEVTRHFEHPADVVARAVEGPAAQVLLNVALAANLLVVGSRGHGAFAGMLLGSVSQFCVQHAPCPVVVVPG